MNEILRILSETKYLLWNYVFTVVKNPPANAGDVGDASLIPGFGRSPGVGNEKVFNFDEVQFICWLLLLFMLFVSYLRIHC